MSHDATTTTHDVVVIGSGAAGSAAALAAHAAGADVLVLEKAPEAEAGGNTRVSGGGWAALADPVGAARFLRALCGRFPVAGDVVDTWAAEMPRNSEWLRGLGAEVRRSESVHVVPDYHDHDGSEAYLGMDTVGGGMGGGVLHDFLRGALAERGIPVRHDQQATGLVRDPDGAVAGVRAHTPWGERSYAARGGVVLATGGFQADPRMVRDHLGLADPVLWGSPYSTGDGHRMARAVGADLWHMRNMMTLHGLEVAGRGMFLSTYAGQSWLLVRPDGRRFRNEVLAGRHGHVVDGNGPELYPLHECWMVLDERMRTAGPLAAGVDMLPVGWGLLVDGLGWSRDNSEEISSGVLRRAETVEGLAVEIGTEPGVLERTVATFNHSCGSAGADGFGRPGDRMAPVATPPFYAVRVVPMLAWSNGGPRRDGRSRVLDVGGAPIPGLYAAGEVSSTYSWGKDGGFHIGDAFAFGRVSGREAAARAAR